jgi:hypothetical protein
VIKYYKSRYLDKPAVYVQEEGQWRGYALGGVLQRSSGLIPEVILAQTVEISQDQAETLIAILRAEAERVRAERAEAARSADPPDPPAPGLAAQAPVTAAPVTAAPVAAASLTPAPVTVEVARASSSSPRSRWPRWLPYALVGGAAVMVVVVLVVLAMTGSFGGGSGATASTGAPGITPAEVVATVGGRSITREQFDQRVVDFEAQYPDRVPDKKNAPDRYKLFQQDVLEYMITYELAAQKAEQLNLMVTDQDVQTQIDLILNTSFSGDQTKFDDALKQQGITMDQFKQTYKESTLFERVYNEVTKDVTAGPGSDALLDAKRKEAWQAWIEQAKAASGVTYTDG